MTQPIAYVPATDFSDFQNSQPGVIYEGDDFDIEFAAIKLTTDQIRANLALIQRDDGLLANSIVTPDALSPSTLALFTATGTPRGAWLTATAYIATDLVTQSGNTYICVSAHTSGTFATDLAAGKWIVLTTGGDVTGPAGSATDGLPAVYSGTTGKILKNATAAQIRTAIGSSSVGDAVFVAASAAAGRSALGSGTIGDAAFVATTRIGAVQAVGSYANGATATKTASYAFTAADLGKLVPVDGTSAAWTQTLTAAATVGAGFVIGFQKIDASYNAVTLDGNGAEMIDGVADFVLTNQYETIWLLCDGANWSVINYAQGADFKDGVTIDQRTVSGVATVDFFKGWTTTRKFRRMVFEWDGVFPATDNDVLIARVSTDGSTFLSTASYFSVGTQGSSNTAPTGFAASTNTNMALSYGSGNSNSNAYTMWGRAEVSEYDSTASFKRWQARCSGRGSDGHATHRIGDYGWGGSNSALLGVRFLMNSGGNLTGRIIQKGYG